MAVNWVMLSPSEGFTPLPSEQRLYVSPARTSISIQSVNKFPGKQPFVLSSPAGTAYLTNRRLVYLPAAPTDALQSFSAPILNLHDTHVAAPFFGPNVWSGIVQAVAGGNIPPEHTAVELKLTFKDGGAFDFHSAFERVKERLQQAMETARDSGSSATAARGLSGIDLDAVHLEDLPAYEEASQTRAVPSQAAVQSVAETTPPAPSRTTQAFSTPNEPPPGYETVQTQSVVNELERRLRDQAEQ